MEPYSSVRLYLYSQRRSSAGRHIYCHVSTRSVGRAGWVRLIATDACVCAGILRVTRCCRSGPHQHLVTMRAALFGPYTASSAALISPTPLLAGILRDAACWRRPTQQHDPLTASRPPCYMPKRLAGWAGCSPLRSPRSLSVVVAVQAQSVARTQSLCSSSISALPTCKPNSARRSARP